MLDAIRGDDGGAAALAGRGAFNDSSVGKTTRYKLDSCGETREQAKSPRLRKNERFSDTPD